MTTKYGHIGVLLTAGLMFTGCSNQSAPDRVDTETPPVAVTAAPDGATTEKEYIPLSAVTPTPTTDSKVSTETAANTAPQSEAATAGETSSDPAPAAVTTETDAPPAATQESATNAAPAANEDNPSATSRVMLGTPELTSGIAGNGPLSVDEIRSWLDNPENHQTLEVELPFGLATGKASIYIPEDNPLTRAKIELGRQLYFDKRLSKDGTVSCADCHHPDEGYARSTQFGVGIGGLTGNRNSPTSYNRILSVAQFWDGRASSLEDQAVGPIANAIEMGNTHEAAVKTIAGIEGYKIQFEKIFNDGVNIKNVGKALASFERVVVTSPSPFDYYEPLRQMRVTFKDDLEDLDSLKEEDPDLYNKYMAALKASEEHPISESAQRGRDIFFSDRGGCTACHVGANLTDEKYHNLGIGMDKEKPDLGRFEVTKDDKDRGAFKTPTIRNVALTAPYMHDGSLRTLDEVVAWYVKGGHPNPHLSKDVRKLKLSEQDQKDLVAFMEACTGTFPDVERERLPK